MNPIGWCDETWNPIIGCSKLSPGCQNCYAERMATRLASMGTRGYGDVVNNGRWNGKTALVESELDKPLRWKTPRRIFVCSMGDLFHVSVKNEWIDLVFAAAAIYSQHTFMMLTKRPSRMLQYMSAGDELWCDRWPRSMAQICGECEPTIFPLRNVWLGVTAENQEQANKRIPVLLDTPAAKRFVSIEPMIGPVDLYRGGFTFLEKLTSPSGRKYDCLDWVICGPENGPHKRPFNLDWARRVRDDCAAAGVPFWYKGGMLDGREHHEVPVC